MYSLLALIHALILTAGTFYALRRYPADTHHKLLAGFLLIWFNLVITGLSLSLFSKLHVLHLYLALSCLIAALTAGAGDLLLKKRTVDSRLPVFGDNDAPWRFSPLVIFSIVVLGIAVIVSALIVLFYYPNNSDSIAYRFPRVFLYLGRGNLMHLAPPDFRMSFYPFNGVLAYVYFAIYRLDGRWFNFLSYATWLISSLGVYVFSRDMGGSRTGSFLASCIYSLSPIVLALAASTNDEIIAATPILLGLIFLYRWWHSGLLADAILGGIGFGLGAATKLHIAFFSIALLAAILVISLNLYRQGLLKRFIQERHRHIIIAGVLAAVLTTPFMIVNMIESGHPLYVPETVDPLLNKPFDAKVALINVSLYSAQLFLSPVPDLVISHDHVFKSGIYDKFNQYFNNKIFYWLDNKYHYSVEPYYYFHGVADPLGWWAVEQTVWIGFAPFLMLFGMVIYWFYGDKEKTTLAVWLLTSFFVWHLHKGFSTKYIESAGTYYSYPFAICAAGLAVLWDRRVYLRKNLSVAIVSLFVMVIATNAVLDVNVLYFNIRRNLRGLIRSHFSPIDIAMMSPALVSSLENAEKIHLVYTRFEYPYFYFMSKNPRARYTSSANLVKEPDVFNVLLYPARSDVAHIPIQLVGDGKERLTALGSITAEFGTEYILGRGNDIHKKHPESSGFIVLHPQRTYGPDGETLSEVNFSREVTGADDADTLEYRLIHITAYGEEYPLSGWFAQSELEKPRKLSNPANGYLRIQVRSSIRHNDIAETWLPLSKHEEIKPGNMNL